MENAQMFTRSRQMSYNCNEKRAYGNIEQGEGSDGRLSEFGKERQQKRSHLTRAGMVRYMSGIKFGKLLVGSAGWGILIGAILSPRLSGGDKDDKSKAKTSEKNNNKEGG